MSLPTDRKYTESHEWVKAEGDVFVVGITDTAQDQLGDLVFVGDVKVGAKLAAGETAGVVESVKAASDIYAPVAGEIVAFNEALESNPNLINESAFTAWIFKIAGQRRRRGQAAGRRRLRSRRQRLSPSARAGRCRPPARCHTDRPRRSRTRDPPHVARPRHPHRLHPRHIGLRRRPGRHARRDRQPQSDALIEEVVPPKIRSQAPLALPPRSETDVLAELKQVAGRNKVTAATSARVTTARRRPTWCCATFLRIPPGTRPTRLTSPRSRRAAWRPC